MNQDERLGAIAENYRRYFGEYADLVIDAGTRDGEDAEYLRQKLNAKRVIAIDANPLAVARTRAAFPDFTVVETALADYVGQATFDQIVSEREDFAGSSSLSKHATFPNATHNQITVNVTTMANVLDDLKITGELDLIKVDLEGYSYEFIKGLGERVKDVKLFHLETETFKRHNGHKRNTDVKELMEELGFRLVDVSYEWGPTIEDQIWINVALAVD